MNDSEFLPETKRLGAENFILNLILAIASNCGNLWHVGRARRREAVAGQVLGWFFDKSGKGEGEKAEVGY